MDSVEERLQRRAQINEQIHNNLWYGIIASSSLITLIFLPMLGSQAGLKWDIPDTTAGWILYITTKVLATALNMIIFIAFNNQGKINASKSKKYQEAIQILSSCKIKNYRPRSPYRWNFSVYSKKIPMIIISTVLGLVAISNAILNYSYVELISYVLVIIFAIIFGLMQMLKSEEYWTIEYYDYAKQVEKELKENGNNL